MRENEREKEEGRSENSKLGRFFFFLKRLQQNKWRRKQFRYVLLLLRSPQVLVSICGLFWSREQRLLICGSADFGTELSGKIEWSRDHCAAPLVALKATQRPLSIMLTCSYINSVSWKCLFCWEAGGGNTFVGQETSFISWLSSFVTQISRHESVR